MLSVFVFVGGEHGGFAFGDALVSITQLVSSPDLCIWLIHVCGLYIYVYLSYLFIHLLARVV